MCEACNVARDLLKDAKANEGKPWADRLAIQADELLRQAQNEHKLIRQIRQGGPLTLLPNAR